MLGHAGFEHWDGHRRVALEINVQPLSVPASCSWNEDRYAVSYRAPINIPTRWHWPGAVPLVPFSLRLSDSLQWS